MIVVFHLHYLKKSSRFYRKMKSRWVSTRCLPPTRCRAVLLYFVARWSRTGGVVVVQNDFPVLLRPRHQKFSAELVRNPSPHERLWRRRREAQIDVHCHPSTLTPSLPPVAAARDLSLVGTCHIFGFYAHNHFIISTRDDTQITARMIAARPDGKKRLAP